MLKYIGVVLALLVALCVAQGPDVDELKKQLEDLERRLHDAYVATGNDAEDRLRQIGQELAKKCPTVLDSLKQKYENLGEDLESLNKKIDEEILRVENGLRELENENFNKDEAAEVFPERKKDAEKLIDDSRKVTGKIDELAKILKTCSASKPDDKTVPQTGGTANIPLAPVTLTMAAAFIAIKLAFH
uniref:Putative secreted protein n=1 Tax=Panstrongylus lignarius TaxID=156445 RepID=A0A224XLE4_9HEMI